MCNVYVRFCSQHIPLWLEYTVVFVFLVLLLPCLWVSYIWDQIIDPHYEDRVEEPDSRLLRSFYRAAKRINASLAARTSIFLAVAVLIVTSALLDVVRSARKLFSFFFPFSPNTLFCPLQLTANCLAESPKVRSLMLSTAQRS